MHFAMGYLLHLTECFVILTHALYCALYCIEITYMYHSFSTIHSHHSYAFLEYAIKVCGSIKTVYHTFLIFTHVRAYAFNYKYTYKIYIKSVGIILFLYVYL